MPAVAIDLGNIKTSTRKPSKLSLTLSVSCTIVLPPSWPGPPTAPQICASSQAGDLWVAKAGSCQLDFLTLINGEPLERLEIDQVLASEIINLVDACSVTAPCNQFPCFEVVSNQCVHFLFL
ncbi:hypothetical protein B0T19DRAFT_251794 [Cercophora scortea]|uniref:Uncharacterized protein n=1 Tax=Cercophora scortea TaxID=314031 RepID=A0AAE0M7L0_9PEZI|nr:hypothetical protein B0T19DRAFT_251794 [Cercophora scortea]